MEFNSIPFYFFIFIVWIISYLTKCRKKTSISILTLIGIPLFFLVAKKHLAALICIIVFSYFTANTLNKKSNRLVLVGSLLSALGVFLFFRYGFFGDLVLSVFPSLILLQKPAQFLGMAFLYLKLVSLFVDIYEEEEDAKISFIDVANYLAFLPTFISGPIDRFSNFKEETESNSPLNLEDFFEGCYRIVLGAFKKIVIANTLIRFSLADLPPDHLTHLGPLTLISSLYLYTLTLYFDFSGYSDIAIGLGRIFGIKVPENFNRPYLARNIQDFWNRWHISFMHWLRDYIYYPLYRLFNTMGIKSIPTIMSFSFIITFSLAGAWHGDGIRFLLTGLYYGICFGLWVLYKHFLEKHKGKKYVKNIYLKNRVLNFIFVVITLNIYSISLVLYLDNVEFIRALWNKII